MNVVANETTNRLFFWQIFLCCWILGATHPAVASIDEIVNAQFLNGTGVLLQRNALSFVTSSGDMIALKGEHFGLLKPNQSQTLAVIVEDRTLMHANNVQRFLLMQEGYVVPLPLRRDGIVEWSYSSFLHKGRVYGVVSFHGAAPRKSVVMIVRTPDGHRIRRETDTYLDQSAQSYVFDAGKLDLDMERFEFNDGYSEAFPKFNKDLFLGMDGDSFKRLALVTTTASLLGSASRALTVIGSKMRFGLEALMSEFSADQDLEDRINARVFGQEHLVKLLVRNAQVVDDVHSTKPRIIVVTGTSGVGKTYLAKILAKEKLDDPAFFLEIDGTKYAAGSKDEATVMAHKLVGAESAYQGQQKGELVEFLKKTNGRGIIVINEGDKIHPHIYTRLMEFFDNGTLTAGDGTIVSGKQTLVVITSNRGARRLIPEGAKNWTEQQMADYVSKMTSEQIKTVYSTKLRADDKDVLPEEVLNRVDEFALSSPLTKSVLNKIFRHAVISQNEELSLKYKDLKFSFSDAALDYLASVNVNIHIHGREMNRRAEGVFKDIKTAISNALVSKKWNPSQVQSLDVSLKEDRAHHWSFTVNNDLVIPVPQPLNPNPMADPEIRKVILNLQTNLKRRVIGQDAMIDNIHQMVVNHLAQGVRYVPTVFMTIGTTGTGKTETGIAIAESVYKSPDRVGIMDLSTVTSSYHYALKFEQGEGGGESEFETYLRNNPDGSVLILDEASNMGGQNKAIKNELFKKFYALFDRGVWVSPVTKQEYDLTKHIIQLTGNDGEHFFMGSTADEDRMAIWKSKNHEDILHELLIDAGIPEALMGRLAALILTKPLLRSEMKPIAEKMLLEKIKPLETQYRGLKITYGDDVLDSLVDSFFNHSRGMRSIRHVVNTRFGSTIQMALLESEIDLNDLTDVKLNLKISDNKSTKPYKLADAPNRNVQLAVDITKKDPKKRANVFKRIVDLTEFAQEQVLDRYDEAWLSALHEAGHAVANDPKITGDVVSFITIRGGTFGMGSSKIKYKGYARTTPHDGYGSPTKEMVIGQLARLAAGSVAEVVSGHGNTAGWSDDLKKMRALAKRAIVSYGFDSRFYGVQVDQEGNTALSEVKKQQLENAMQELIEEGIQLAKTRLIKKWDAVVNVAKELMVKGEIYGVRFEEISKSSVDAKDGTTHVSPTYHGLQCFGFYSFH